VSVKQRPSPDGVANLLVVLRGWCYTLRKIDEVTEPNGDSMRAMAHLFVVGLRHIDACLVKLAGYNRELDQFSKAFRHEYRANKLKDLRDALEHFEEYIDPQSQGKRPELRVKPQTTMSFTSDGVAEVEILGRRYVLRSIRDVIDDLRVTSESLIPTARRDANAARSASSNQ
jgi:hypothetical protein